MAQTDIKINTTQELADIFAASTKIPFTTIMGFGANAGETNNKTVDVVVYKAGTAASQSRSSIAWTSTGKSANEVATVTLSDALLEIVNLQTNPSPTFALQMGRASVDTIINGLEDYLLRPLSATTQTSAISAVNTVAGFQTFIGKQKKAIGDLGGYSLVLDSAEYATLKSNLVAGLSQPDYWNDGAPFGVKVYESIVLNTLGIKGFFFHRSVMSWGAGVEKGFAVAGVEATPAVAGNGVPMIFMQYSNGGDIMAAFGFYIGKTVSSSLNTLAVKLT